MITREQFDEKWDYARGCIDMRGLIWEFIEQEREQYQVLVDYLERAANAELMVSSADIRRMLRPILPAPPTSIADRLDAAVEDFLNHQMTVFEYNEKVQAIAAELREGEG